MFDAQINNVLLKGAEAIAKDAKANAPTERIRANVTISPIQDTPTGKQITIYVPLGNEDGTEGAPEARAYELGSGIHSTVDTVSPNQQGPKGKIDIYAKNAPNLIFFWERKDKWFVGPHVEHPGVEARPYLAPAVEKNRNTLRGLISRVVGVVTKAAILTGFKE